MFSLITAVLTIALFSTIAAISINHVPVDALIAYRAKGKAQDGFKSLAAGAARYIRSSTDANGLTILPVAGTDLNGIIDPHYAFIPPAPTGMRWNIRSAMYAGLPAVSICLEPVAQVDDVTLRGATSVKKDFAVSAFFINASCGATSNAQGSALTYWVVVNHTNGF